MNNYLNRFSIRKQFIHQKPNDDLGIVIVIPCCNEPDLFTTLSALKKCTLPSCSIEIIVVINSAEDAEQNIKTQNKLTLEQTQKWIKNNSIKQFNTYIIEEINLPKKHAGVGLARKIGMDEAVSRFEQVKNHKGIIACFDADTVCKLNYLVELENHFKENPKTPGCSIYFEHPLEGNIFDEKIYSGILYYELHLRYYKNGLKYAGLPYAFHTVGSSMAVRSEAYQKQNGMNKRKAGEDFYFLQKIIALGNFTTLSSTKVFPSPRISDRVPFGTGKAMHEWVQNEKKEFSTYHLQSFIDLKEFSLLIPNVYDTDNLVFPKSITAFLKEINYHSNLSKIRRNSTSKAHFTILFFKWFNAFKVLKFVHFARDNFYPNQPIIQEASSLLHLLSDTYRDIETGNDAQFLLKAYRKLDRNNS